MTSHAGQLTAQGRAQLRAELDHLRREREPAITALLRARREETDTWEASGYYLALQEDLARVQHRIQELEVALAAAPGTAVPHPPGTVAIGSRVTARDDADRERAYVIVSPLEADAGRGDISAASPIGAALLGHRAGDAVVVTVPAGLRTFTVLQVE